MSKAEVTAIDILTPDRIAGWYHCFKSSSNQIVILIQGRPPKHVMCDGDRPDVLDSEFGLSACGFDVRFDPPVNSSDRIEIASQATGIVLFSGSISGGLISTEGGADISDISIFQSTVSAAATAPLLVFDLTNLVTHIGHQDNLTGIQRVQSCIVLSIFRHNIHPAKNILLVTYDRSRGRFLSIKSSYMISLLEDLMQPLGRRIVSFDRKRATEGALPNATFLDLSVEDSKNNIILCQLGAVVGESDYFYRINEIKREFGAHFVMALYDMIPVYCASTCDGNIVKLFRRGIDQALRCTDLFLTCSENTDRDLKRYTDEQELAPPTTVVTQAGSSFDEFIANRSSVQKYDGLPDRYVLFVSTIEGRKNHRLMFDVWAQLSKDVDEVPSLVCVGKIGWRAEEFLQRLIETDHLGQRIVILENVSDTQLDALYRNCLFSVFPSFYEGWGLPVSEALSKGKICVASNKGSIPEVGGDLVVYIDIDNPKSAQIAIQRLITDEPYRLQLEQRVAQNYRPIAWRTVAERVVEGCLSARSREPTGLWPSLEIGREYIFRDAPQVARDRAGMAMLNSIKEARRGVLTSAFWDDESFYGATESRHGKGWSFLEDWGSWSLYRPCPELWFSLPETAGPEVDWYLSMRTLPLLEGRYCQVTIDNQTFANIRLPRSGGLLRLGRLQVGASPEKRRYAVKFCIEQDDALEATLRDLDPRAPGIGFCSMIFLESQDYSARLELLEGQMWRINL